MLRQHVDLMFPPAWAHVIQLNPYTLRRAIEASLAMPDAAETLVNGDVVTGIAEDEEESLLAEALAVSARETALEEERRAKEDDELLRRILELSLMEKWIIHISYLVDEKIR